MGVRFNAHYMLSIVFFKYLGKMCNECRRTWTFIYRIENNMNNLMSYGIYELL